ncbi:MAG: DNA-processing protein DprA [Aquificae bacterium]|nr:DNA-processing protein DprA [Aquificota bacterium]
MNPALENFLRLYSLKGVGPKFLKRFYRTVGTFEGDLEDLVDLFAEREGLPPAKVERLKAALEESEREFERLVRFLEREKVKVIPFFEADFPSDLRKVGEEVAALFAVGRFDYSTGFSIVGTRKASREGRLKASAFAAELARAGFMVVSGGAEGVDLAAHEGALAAGGRTAVVLGEGLARYLERNRPFAERVLESGGFLVSQFPPFFAPAKWSFPKRNALIAVLGLFGLLVVEAPERSGALITADYALRLRRPLFAYVGCTYQPNYAGSVELVSEKGAKLVVDPRRLVKVLTSGRREGSEPPGERTPAVSPPKGETEGPSSAGKKVLDLLRERPRTFDELLALTGAAPEELLTLLTELEVEGAVVCEGGFYRFAG